MYSNNDRVRKITDVSDEDSSLSKIENLYKKVEELNRKYHADNLKSYKIEEDAVKNVSAELSKRSDIEKKRRQKDLELELKIKALKESGDKKESARLEKERTSLKKQYELEEKLAKSNLAKEQQKEERNLRQKNAQDVLDNSNNPLARMSAYWTKNVSQGYSGGKAVLKSLDTVIDKLATLSKKLDTTIEQIASYKSSWDTRLFGSNSNHSSITDLVSKTLGATPYVKQSAYMKNVDEIISKGIAYNVEQRAFLETVKDNIATTFDAFDSTLLNIIRVQQADSTGARLGMEASLNKYLNNMYSNTEYLSNLSDSVTSALYEATSLLDSKQSIGFEYQVQKWLGSLYSVGMSNNSITSLANALGQLASGDVNGIESGTGKLLALSASKAGINYSDMLIKGIDESDVNSLLKSVVSYLSEIADTAKGNKVVQKEYASIFGLSTSDIIAATNLKSSLKDIFNQGSSYGYESAMGSLAYMSETIGQRMSMGEKMQNVLDNFSYTLAEQIANNVGLYTTWSLSKVLDVVGGINIPTIMAFGNGVDMEATVSDLMKAGAFSASIFAGIGNLVNGAQNSSNGIEGMIKALGITSQSSVTRGKGFQTTSGMSTSATNYVGNSSGNDISDATYANIQDEKNNLQVSAAEESNSIDINTINDNIVLIYNLFKDITEGSQVLNVRLSDNLFNPSQTGFEGGNR